MYATKRGLPIDSKLFPLVRDLFNVPIEKLEAEAERARKYKTPALRRGKGTEGEEERTG
jgi:hypothetical protein